MLILNRKVGESVCIANGTVTIVSIGGKSVRFGFDFPDDTMIFRAELSADQRTTLTDQLRSQNDLGLTLEGGLLILSRAERESFHIGSGITLTLMKVNGSRVSLGIEAPQSVRIVRSEIAHENAAA